MAAKAFNLAKKTDEAMKLLSLAQESNQVTLLIFNSAIETLLKTREFDQLDEVIADWKQSGEVPVLKEDGTFDNSVLFTMIKGFSK